jgi:hypothetical protein
LVAQIEAALGRGSQERHGRIAVSRVGRGADGEIVDTDLRGVEERQRAFDHVFELAGVALPRPRLELLHRSGRHRAAFSLGVLLHEGVYEGRNVFGTLAKRRNVNRNDVEAVVEVLAEVPLLDLSLQLLVRGGHDPDVHRDPLRSSDGADHAVLKNSQQLALEALPHVADLVEKEGSAVRLLEQTALGGVRPRERPLDVPEQLALEKTLGNRRTVDGNEGLLGARAVVMERSRDHFLARPALTRDENTASTVRDLADQRSRARSTAMRAVSGSKGFVT